MAIYLRFTDEAQDDLERGTSYHSLNEYEVAELVEKYGDSDIEGKADNNGAQIVSWGDGEFSSEIGGLCGYELEAETLEEALEEVANGNFSFDYYGAMCLFEGEATRIANILGDGVIFKPVSILRDGSK